MSLRQAQSGEHTYLRLVENYRQDGKVRQRVVLHLGRKDLLAPHLDTLVRLLQEDQPSPRWSRVDQLSTPQAWTWGPLLAARHLWDELSLGAILDGKRLRRRHGQPLSERATPPRTRVVKVPGKVPGVRVFVVHSEEREHYERSLRELAMERTR